MLPPGIPCAGPPWSFDPSPISTVPFPSIPAPFPNPPTRSPTALVVSCTNPPLGEKRFLDGLAWLPPLSTFRLLVSGFPIPSPPPTKTTPYFTTLKVPRLHDLRLPPPKRRRPIDLRFSPPRFTPRSVCFVQ